eukprot:CAMPEP_0205923242 /NCGR_PEP_ID=MMETSP1325-20131115/15885_1 /ASSEMBLY_ACC=CAM_ASM_000708 /TAXON_ID=236786 /ORGANISM="Florenciella sp., Strain RCC1007" /LENGTH=154 /DNA_ID=CAMNT_0053291425 /DNA_START=51 /DNA_END=513 /DNA_ORIENTATION=-
MPTISADSHGVFSLVRSCCRQAAPCTSRPPPSAQPVVSSVAACGPLGGWPLAGFVAHASPSASRATGFVDEINSTVLVWIEEHGMRRARSGEPVLSTGRRRDATQGLSHHTPSRRHTKKKNMDQVDDMKGAIDSLVVAAAALLVTEHRHAAAHV